MNQIVQLISLCYSWLIKIGNLCQPLFLLFFRLNWGWQFFVTGKGKLLNHKDIVEFFASLNIPFPDMNAWFVGGLECTGGILLILGLASRPIAFLLAGNMTVAYLSVEADRETVFNFFKDQDPFLQADPFFFLLTAIIVFCFGPGPISLDALIAKTIAKKKAEAKI
jgi:putative oxidoreductase